MRVRDAVATVLTVWRRSLLDALVAPRRFRRVMSEFRRVNDMLFHPGIGSLELGQLPRAEQPIQMLSLGSGYGGMAPQDLYALLRVLRWVEPRRVFEFGTFQGVTTAHLVANSAAEVYTLDLPRELARDLAGYAPLDAALLQPRDAIGAAYRDLNANGRVRQLFGDSRTFDCKPFYGTAEFVLVDACHFYDYVLSDSRQALQLLGERGVILWHDFVASLDVTRALKELAREIPIFHLEGTFLAAHFRGRSPLDSVEAASAPNASANPDGGQTP